MAKVDIEIVRQVLQSKIENLTQENLAAIVGEIKSVAEANAQDDAAAKPKKIKKKVINFSVSDSEDHVLGISTLKVPVTIEDEEILYKVINTAALDHNATRSTNRGKIENTLLALELLKNKELKPYGVQILSRPSDGLMETAQYELDESLKLTEEEIKRILGEENQEDDAANEQATQQQTTTEEQSSNN